MISISIVIPVHNEAENIGKLVTEIVQLKLGHPYEIIVVDDASTDESYATLLQLLKRIPTLRAIQHDSVYGQSAAIATGIAHAIGEIVVTMDGDCQNDPADIPALVGALLNGASSNVCLVAGFRKKRSDSAWRIFSSKVANSLRRLILRDETPDTGCGLKVFYRSSFLKLPFFDHMHRFLPALIQMQGGRVISMEVNHRPRRHGVSKYGTLDRLWSGLVDLHGVCWLRLRAKEVRIRRCDQ